MKTFQTWCFERCGFCLSCQPEGHASVCVGEECKMIKHVTVGLCNWRNTSWLGHTRRRKTEGHFSNRDTQAGSVLLLSWKQTAVDIPVTNVHFWRSTRLDSNGGSRDRGIKLSESGWQQACFARWLSAGCFLPVCLAWNVIFQHAFREEGSKITFRVDLWSCLKKWWGEGVSFKNKGELFEVDLRHACWIDFIIYLQILQTLLWWHGHNSLLHLCVSRTHANIMFPAPSLTHPCYTLRHLIPQNTNKHSIPHPPTYPPAHMLFLTKWSCQGNGEEMTQGIFSQISPVGILNSGTGPVSSLSPQFNHQTQPECQTHWDVFVFRQEGRWWKRQGSGLRMRQKCD